MSETGRTETGKTLLVSIEAARDHLSRSEARVADVILSDPNRAVEMSIAAISEAADVSEPTVARFCKSLGFSGLKEFKLRLARSLGAGIPFVHQDVKPGDDASAVVGKMLDRASSALARLAEELDSRLLAKAAKAMAEAPRLEFYGQGNSGIVALDAQHKFFRLGIPTAAYSDPHVHAMSAALLGPKDVVIAISASGRTLDLIRSVEIARDVGATVIGLTTRGSPLTRLCDVAITTDVEEDADVYSPMLSRHVHLAIIDVLSVLTALERGDAGVTSLARAKRSVREKRASSG
ncbi:MAG: SIS domain-containing protein [Methylobacterium sp.]|jgi:RpiR family carbohydrate utilization transcriptional regulator|uniref:SIS domain-containing protein n=1 Tax=Rhabdaerophilum sp. TaxID=2717341 RepID=UPI002A1EEFB3|nr:SIS domain-containing protein [Methylobacterium sp.]MCA3655322.1 SIS domain-containing protein [Methylobacterium sp.]MCA3659118.1 SIS domain-containing protein [Methylobacterium sp.]MCA3661153.1 SIS domain-containing protein [Methylobacterium sp.]MCA3663074.1 SIS domain-containing protein [Methylobacterium sp.]